MIYYLILSVERLYLSGLSLIALNVAEAFLFMFSVFTLVHKHAFFFCGLSKHDYASLRKSTLHSQLFLLLLMFDYVWLGLHRVVGLLGAQT